VVGGCIGAAARPLEPTRPVAVAIAAC
jgi:hypothetical protein